MASLCFRFSYKIVFFLRWLSDSEFVLLRLSVGIEDFGDLRADLEQALKSRVPWFIFFHFLYVSFVSCEAKLL